MKKIIIVCMSLMLTFLTIPRIDAGGIVTKEAKATTSVLSEGTKPQLEDNSQQPAEPNWVKDLRTHMLKGTIEHKTSSKVGNGEFLGCSEGTCSWYVSLIKETLLEGGKKQVCTQPVIVDWDTTIAPKFPTPAAVTITKNGSPECEIK